MATDYEPVIGLEVHAQLLTRSKLFCGCSTEYGAPPNTHVCPVCLGLPGALPVPNGHAIEMAARAAMALGCVVNHRSRFARKNYFYPDLAKGYQISQYELPLNERGRVEIEVGGERKAVGITRIHVEEDAAKNLHGVGAGAQTLVDFNRAGVPLIEIVSEPDLRSAEEAEAYLKRLREILMFVGVNDGNLEEGSFRCDANVSIRPVGTEAFGVRAELKNINSFRFVRKAIEHEIARQEAVVSSGGHVVQETRTWSEGQGKTVSMRGKEEAHDYRYFPDPDLPPLVLDEARIMAFKERMPEPPEEKRVRWQRDLGLTAYDAQVLTGHPEVARLFEDTAAALVARWGGGKEAEAGKKAANFIQAEVLRDVVTDGLSAHFPVTAGQVAELLAIVQDGTISGKMAKDVYAEMVKTGRGAKRIVDEQGLAQVTDAGAIEAEVDKVLEAHPSEVEKYRGGKTNLLGFFVGQVMKATRGSANPKMVNEILRKKLS
ncbi:MAG: Asp-tRNA(Asn)/Glu-tRNA(Gln) amidotransferase subunit GatB [Myxococcota bacterium]